MVQVSIPPPSIIRSSPIKPPHRLSTNHLALSYSPSFSSNLSIVRIRNRQGHVDATAEIVSRIADGNSIRYTFAFPSTSKSNFMPYLIEKGYVTIDGASLTLTHVSPVSSSKREFGIMLIAHSQEKLTLTSKDVGGTVNVEVDCVGKYVLRSLEGEDAEGEGQGGLRALVERMVERKINERLEQQ